MDYYFLLSDISFNFSKLTFLLEIILRLILYVNWFKYQSKIASLSSFDI